MAKVAKADWQKQLLTQNFSFSKFIFQLRATEEIHLPPYKGSALRGGFGNVFKKVCCTVKNQDCLHCSLKQNCAYAYIFETPNHNELHTHYNADYYPHPFVIEPPVENKTSYAPGEILNFSVILFGTGIQFLPYFIYAFDQFGRTGLGKGKGKVILENTTSVENLASMETKQIYDVQSKILQGNYTVWEYEKMRLPTALFQNSIIQIKFLTPTRITVKGKLANQFSFELFLRTLLRRISLLGKIHCNSDWNLPYYDIFEYARENVAVQKDSTMWVDWERYSSRQKTRMKLGGLAGEIVFQGAIEPFYKLLMLGQYAHLGKNTSFGLGKYVLI